MAEWFEVYEDAAARTAAEQHVRRLAVGFALASGALVAAAPVTALAWPGWSMAVALATLALLVGHAAWLVWQVRRARRAVWRLDLSVHHVVGHDVGGRRCVLAWSDVTWIDVGEGIDVVGRRLGRRVRFVLPPTFPDHAHVGHRIVRYAEAFGRPVFVDGRPAEALDISPLRQILSGPPVPSDRA
ncbi:MAG TPA: hypothetical protein VGB53_01495 [Rubricoccaceae bacterium]|jgi:hypothetical protein